jgi:hypothetical protein
MNYVRVDHGYRERLESAIVTYKMTGYHQGELARAFFLLGEVLCQMNLERDALAYQTQAKVIRDDMVTTNFVDLADLRGEDFDELVVILKR